MLTFLLCLFTLVIVRGNEEEFRKIDAIYQEEACSAAGGICNIATDCPAGHLSEIRGLCSRQKIKGIECCHGLSMKETRCLKHGGTCMMSQEFCNPQQVFMEATDCPQDTKCCIMTL